ncbi:MAG: hypothetical protein PF961_08590 [Planctomycetota bacterium]|nr:hypothetical protein [Planctomycetota bacterium]
MSCTVLGPGLLGCFLGAAANAAAVITGPSGHVRSQRVQLPNGQVREWAPLPSPQVRDRQQILVCCRCPDTPWHTLPDNCLVAQNGLGQQRNTIACFLGVDQDTDGVIHATGPQPRLVLQQSDPGWADVIAAWRDAGIIVDLVANAEAARWEKTILNATVGPLCLATGLSMGEVWDDPALRSLCLQATREGDAIARANNVSIPAGLEQRAVTFFGAMSDHRPSLLNDPRELPWVLDVLLDTAAKHGCEAEALGSIHRRCHSGQVRVLQT